MPSLPISAMQPHRGQDRNYRWELIWKLFISNPEVGPALKAIGIEKDQATRKPGPKSDVNKLPGDESTIIRTNLAASRNTGCRGKAALPDAALFSVSIDRAFLPRGEERPQ
ncbi:MAG: hypothetical protein H0V18_11465 [Pyrinomonadaceae bacterium]|nr:hypothetical protein [Pyrinomonadaceae bacterium]